LLDCLIKRRGNLGIRRQIDLGSACNHNNVLWPYTISPVEIKFGCGLAARSDCRMHVQD